MTDADTPRVPEFRWAPVPQWGGAVYIKSNRGNWFELHAALDPVELPADSVKLGDTRELEVEIATLILQLARMEDRARAAARQRDALRADIRAVLEDRDDDLESIVNRAIALLDREPGRAEPTGTAPDRSGRWVDGQLQPFGPRDLDGWQPTHDEAVSGD